MFLGRRARPVRKADNLTAICGIFNISTACYGDSFTFAFIFYDFNYTPTTLGGGYKFENKLHLGVREYYCYTDLRHSSCRDL
jgi:hypothetical protein